MIVKEAIRIIKNFTIKDSNICDKSDLIMTMKLGLCSNTHSHALFTYKCVQTLRNSKVANFLDSLLCDRKNSLFIIQGQNKTKKKAIS